VQILQTKEYELNGLQKFEQIHPSSFRSSSPFGKCHPFREIFFVFTRSVVSFVVHVLELVLTWCCCQCQWMFLIIVALLLLLLLLKSLVSRIEIFLWILHHHVVALITTCIVIVVRVDVAIAGDAIIGGCGDSAGVGIVVVAAAVVAAAAAVVVVVITVTVIVVVVVIVTARAVIICKTSGWGVDVCGIEGIVVVVGNGVVGGGVILSDVVGNFIWHNTVPGVVWRGFFKVGLLGNEQLV